MTGVVRQAPLQFARLSHVVEDEHAAHHLARTAAPWRCCALHIEFIAIATYEQSRTQSLHGLLLTHRGEQRIFHRFAGFLMESAEHLADVTA